MDHWWTSDPNFPAVLSSPPAARSPASTGKAPTEGGYPLISNPRSGICSTEAKTFEPPLAGNGSGAEALSDRFGVVWGADELVEEIDGPREIGEQERVAMDRGRERFADVTKAEVCQLLRQLVSGTGEHARV